MLTLWQRKPEERALYHDAVWGIEEASATVRAHLLPFIEVDCSDLPSLQGGAWALVARDITKGPHPGIPIVAASFLSANLLAVSRHDGLTQIKQALVLSLLYHLL